MEDFLAMKEDAAARALESGTTIHDGGDACMVVASVEASPEFSDEEDEAQAVAGPLLRGAADEHSDDGFDAVAHWLR